MGDVEPDYTDPLEAAVAAELIECRPDISKEGARAGAHVIVSGVDAAAGTLGCRNSQTVVNRFTHARKKAVHVQMAGN